MSQLFSAARFNKRLFFRQIMSICLGMVLLILSACSAGGRSSFGNPLSTSQSKTFNPGALRQIAVMPLHEGFQPQGRSGAADSLTKSLVNAFEMQTSFEILNGSDPATAAKVWEEIGNAQEPDRRKAAVFGKKLGADAVLYGVLTQFYNREERARYGATAAFKLWLIDPRTEQVLWTATYEDREQPLSENLLRLPQKLEGGLGFKTAEDLAADGFASAARALEQQRKSRGE